MAHLLANRREPAADALVEVGVTLWKRAILDLGYRYWELEFHETTNEATIRAHGPFLQLAFRF